MKLIDFSKKRFKNQQFAQGNPLIKISILVCIFLILFFLFSFYLIFFSNFFLIDKIVIAGNQHIVESDLKKLISEQLNQISILGAKQNNILFFNNKQAESIIKSNYILQKIKVSKSYPNAIRIDLIENDIVIVWISGGESFYVDLYGTAISLVSNEQYNEKQSGDLEILRHAVIEKGFPIVYDKNNRGVSVGSAVAPAGLFKKIIKISESLPKKINYEIANYNYNSTERNITAVSADGWFIYFNIDENVDSQLDNLYALFNREIKSTVDLEYIDLRFGEKVYYKNK